MTENEKNTQALKAMISSAINFYRLEELGRIEYFVQNDKRHLTNVINRIKRRVGGFNDIDKKGIGAFDELVSDADTYVDKVGELDPSLYPVINNIIQGDQINISLMLMEALKLLKNETELEHRKDINKVEQELKNLINRL